jgi:DNA-binding CsgD family transcriptional regulator
VDDARFSRLTERQKTCLRLVRAGYTTKEIAAQLDASPSAIDKTVKLAMAKLGVDRRSVAARLLEKHEAEGGYQRLGPPRIDLPDRADTGRIDPSPRREEMSEYPAPMIVREERSRFEPLPSTRPARAPDPDEEKEASTFDVAIAMRSSADWIVKICSALALVCVAALILSRLWDWYLSHHH